MKTFFLVLYSTVLGVIEHNNILGKRSFAFHYDIPEAVQPDTKVLLCLVERDDADVGVFTQLPGVEVLGDPLSSEDAKKKLTQEQVQWVSHMGVKQGDTVVDLAVAAGKMHPIMRVRGI